MSILQLPYEVLSYTLSFVPYHENAVLRQVCKIFLSINNKKSRNVKTRVFLNSIWRVIWAESCGLNLSKIKFNTIYHHANFNVMKFLIPMLNTSVDRNIILTRAIREGNINTVRYIISTYMGRFPTRPNDYRVACKSGNIEILKLLRDQTICKKARWDKVEHLALSKSREMRDLILSGELD